MPIIAGRGAMHERVLAALRQDLMVGIALPGQMMSLRKLATVYGTSPMPIREALTQLVAAGALEELPNRSVRVPMLTRARLTELFEVRVLVEGEAAKRAFAHATPGLIRRLSRLNAVLLKAIRGRDVPGCLAANQHFHFTLYEAAESSVLMPLIESLWLQCGPTMHVALTGPDMPWDASAHVNIIEGLRSGDSRMMQKAVTTDIRATAGHLLKQVAFAADALTP